MQWRKAARLKLAKVDDHGMAEYLVEITYDPE
jgi:hypothetical protein